MRLVKAICALLCAVPLHAQQKLTLRQIVDEALQRNLELLARRFDINIAEARLLQARLRPNPRLGVESIYLDLLGAGFDPQESPAGPTETSTSISWELETAGKRRWRTLAAGEAGAAARHSYLDARRALILEIQDAYLGLVLARENARTLREILATFEALVKVNQTRFEAGRHSARGADAERGGRARFPQPVAAGRAPGAAAGDPAAAPDGAALARAGFRRRGGDPPRGACGHAGGADGGGAGGAPGPRGPAPRAARAEAEIRLQQALARPNVDIGVTHHKQFVGSLPGQSLGLRVELALPVLNRNQGEIERARQEREQAAARVRALEQQIRAEVAAAWEQVQTARRLLESMEREMIGQARRVRDTIEFSYRRGEASFIDLLDAQRTFAETMQGYNEARVEYARTLYLLDAIAAREAP